MKIAVGLLLGWLLSVPLSAVPGAEASLIRINGAIGPATADYISRAIRIAGDKQASCLIVELDTPGGLLDSTKQIVQSFYGSRVPVIVYVAPSGANAGSAGCFITLAADIAAMAPNTSIGAAHPVSIGGSGGVSTNDVMSQKLENFAASYIEAIAEKRGRNAEWAKASVVKSESITAEKALELKVIDLIAKDVPDLLSQVDGRRAGDKTLSVKDSNVVEIPPLPREKIFQVIWRPEVMMLLLLVAVYGIIGEVSNPGTIIPGTVGVIALVLFLYMSSVLPINIAGLALILLAVGLFVADVFAPSHGVLTFGGIVSFFLGSLMLFNKAGPGFRVPLALIIPATLITAAFFIFIVSAGLRAQFNPVRTGRETMIGQVVPALSAINSEHGKVFIEGEYWNAVSPLPVAEGETVKVVAIQGLTLNVTSEKVRKA
jgi:membrane-bound serine protease (ClpP class)